MIGRQEQLKLLLNQSNPASLGRTLTYYGYFAQERSGKIDTIQSRGDAAAAVGRANRCSKARN